MCTLYETKAEPDGTALTDRVCSRSYGGGIYMESVDSGNGTVSADGKTVFFACGSRILAGNFVFAVTGYSDAAFTYEQPCWCWQ